MITGSDTQNRIQCEVCPYLPMNIRQSLQNMDKSILLALEEIRLRAERPVMLHFHGMDGFIKKNGRIGSSPYGALITSSADLMETACKICENSWYAYQEEINKGYITIRGGHRIGLVGTPIVDENRIINIRDISSMNIRIAREIKGCGERIVKHIVRNSRDIYNTLVISPPGVGKTTLLRDVIRFLSDGFPPVFSGRKVGVVDERGELAALYKGVPSNDLGYRTDIINGICKKVSMEILLRSMSPNIIALDELGNPSDVSVIFQVINAGVRIVATAHGYNLESLENRRGYSEIIRSGSFERFIILSEDKAFKYHAKILDGDGNVIALDSESGRKPFDFGEFYDSRVCVFPPAYGKDREYTGDSGFLNGAGK